MNATMITTNAISPVPLLSRRNPHIKRMAIFQVISGGLSLVLGIIGVIWYSVYDGQVGAGIWGGLLIIVTGIVGYTTVKKNAVTNARATYIAYMVLNIISAVFIAGAILCTTVTASYVFRYIDCDPNAMGSYWCRKVGQNARASWGVSITLAINLSAAFVASIIGSVLSCVCCERSINSSARYTTGPVANQQPMGQVVIPNQYVQQPQIVSPYQQQQQQQQQQSIFQQQLVMLQQPWSQQQPNMLQQPMVQHQSMILQQSANQQPYLLQQYPEAQAQPQLLRPGELNQPIDEDLPKKGGSNLPSYDSLQ